MGRNHAHTTWTRTAPEPRLWNSWTCLEASGGMDQEDRGSHRAARRKARTARRARAARTARGGCAVAAPSERTRGRAAAAWSLAACGSRHGATWPRAWLAPRGSHRAARHAVHRARAARSARRGCAATPQPAAALARLHVRTVKSSAERCSVSPNSPAARANSRSRPARRATSRISRRARVASGLSAFWMMEGRHARLSSEHEADGTSGEDPARRGARKQSELFIGTKLQHFSAVSSASPLGGLSTCCC